jgi:hypothetical protein
MSKLTTAQVNDLFFQKVASSDPAGLTKAASAVQEYTRLKMREDGFLRKIMPPIPITNADLDRELSSDRNRVIVDKETPSDIAVSVPYGKLPAMKYIRTDRYAVQIQRTLTKFHYKDLSTFRTDHADVRQILGNNLTKDLLAEEDAKFIRVVDAIVGSTAGLNVDDTDTNVQYVEIDESEAGYPTRIGFNEALKVLPRLESSVPCSTMLINSIMINDLQKWGRDELGGDIAGEIAVNGWAERTLFGHRLIVTIKRNLVADDVVYMFAEPKFMGKFFTLQDTTIHMERENGFIVKFFAYKEDGAAIGNTLSVGKAKFITSTGS